MKEYVGTKSVIGLSAAVFGYLNQSITELVIVLAFLVLLDYITAVTVSLMRGDFDKDKGVQGAIKKIFYAVLLVACYLLDYTILYLTSGLGVDLPVKALFGIAITVILIGNEGFSLAKNLIQIGVPVPEIVLKGFGLIKDEAGKIVVLPKKKEDEENV